MALADAIELFCIINAPQTAPRPIYAWCYRPLLTDVVVPSLPRGIHFRGMPGGEHSSDEQGEKK